MKNEDAQSRLNDDAYVKMRRVLKKKARTVEELSQAIDVDHRTIYRYLRRLQDVDGVVVIRRGSSRPIRYEILAT